MTYVQYIEFLIDFVCVQLMEAGFIVFVTTTLCKIKLNFSKLILTTVICAIVGSIILPFGNYMIVNRIIYMLLVGVVITIMNKRTFSSILIVYKNMVFTVLIMMIVEFISFMSLLYFTGKEVVEIQQNIVSAVVFFIPVRIMEYITCHLIYIKFGGKHEKVN